MLSYRLPLKAWGKESCIRTSAMANGLALEEVGEGLVVFPAVGVEVTLVGGDDAAIAELFGEEDEGGIG